MAGTASQQHRIDSSSNEGYREIPIYTAHGTHVAVFSRLTNWHRQGEVLELGSGGGAFAQRLADAGFTVTASDLTADAFRARTPFVSLDLNEPFHRAFEQRQFDCVVAIEVIEHLENPQHFLREVTALLKPNGTLWLTFPNLYLYSVLPDLWLRGELVHWSRHQFHTVGHQQVLTDWLVELYCEKHGLAVVNKWFVSPVTFSVAYPNPLKRLLAYAMFQAQALIGFRSGDVSRCESVLLQIQRADALRPLSGDGGV